MSDIAMYELSDQELDAVAAGQQGIGLGGLIGAGVNISDIDIDVDVDVTRNEVLNNLARNANVGIGVAVALLGPAGVVQQLTQ